MNLIESFNLLLAQRQVMLSSFQCMPKNIEDNTQSLTVILKMIQQKKILTGRYSVPILRSKLLMLLKLMCSLAQLTR